MVFNTFTTDTAAANVDDTSYGMPLNSRRRSALFNLYAFTAEDTSQKVIASSGGGSGSSVGQTASIAKDPGYTIPTLALDNVEVRNFLYDQQALIYVEKDNYIVKSDTISAKT